MTNEERVRELLRDMLPDLLIGREEQEDGSILFVTSDGVPYLDYDEAIEHEKVWLASECTDTGE